jgi:hypothetical protein
MPGRLFRAVAMVLVLVTAVPALAEQLKFDHRLYPPLKAVFDSGRTELIQYNDKNPAYVTDLIVVRGTSVRDWTEAMIIIARSPGKKVLTAADWMAELQRQAQRECASQFSILAQDAVSITFERQSQGCAASYPATAIYRIVQGKKSLFLLGVMSKTGLSSDSRVAWLALFGSAELE